MSTPNSSVITYFSYILLASLFIYFDFTYEAFSKPKIFYNSTVLTSKYTIKKYITEPLREIPSSFRSKSKLKKENKELKEKLNKEYISNFIISNNEQFFLNEDQLKNFVDSKFDYNKAVFSKLVNFDTYSYFCCDNHDMAIRAISKPDQNLLQRPVISSGGLLGQVISDSNGIQEVMLISSTDHYIPIKSKDFYCNARGSGKPMIISCTYNKFIWDSPLKIGQDIYSSGLGGVYPKGIFLGQVIEILEKNDSHNEVRFKLTTNPLEYNFFAILISQ